MPPILKQRWEKGFLLSLYIIILNFITENEQIYFVVWKQKQKEYTFTISEVMWGKQNDCEVGEKKKKNMIAKI